MENIPKLKSSALKTYRLQLLEAQGYRCAICKGDCTEDQAVLDHDHKHGHVRAVLHRSCNAVEGKIVNALRRYGIKDPYTYLTGLIEYHNTHATNQSGFIHPLHFTPEEKLERRKIKAKKARVKAKAMKSS